MLPGIYALGKVPVPAHIEHTEPENIYCRHCGSETQTYIQMQVMLDSWIDCNLFAVLLGAYFVSEHLLDRLKQSGAHGYVSAPISSFRLSDQLRLLYPDHERRQQAIPRFHYLAITGQCDGPWMLRERLGDCSECGRPMARVVDEGDPKHRIATGMPQPTRLVYPESWHGEDFFYLSEPGGPLITNKVADILAEMGDLRQEDVDAATRDQVRRLMPGYAGTLEKRGWRISPCLELEPAHWVLHS
jgi:hypothetical protein